jgi:CheY-like chemotaxis protein
MVVEDNDQVRQLAIRALTRLGYSVIEAENGEQALLKLESGDGRVDLLITDVVMPTMGGRQLVERLRSKGLRMRVLYMSGYAPSAITHQGLVDTGTPTLQKPFTPNVLARKVRQVLDDDASANRSALPS